MARGVRVDHDVPGRDRVRRFQNFNVNQIEGASASAVRAGISFAGGSNKDITLSQVTGQNQTGLGFTEALVEFDGSGDIEFALDDVFWRYNPAGSARFSGTMPTLRTAPLRVKAGVPADGDFPSTPLDGTQVVDTVNSRLYVRVGGSWKYAGLT